jgi:hypothetical protein
MMDIRETAHLNRWWDEISRDRRQALVKEELCYEGEFELDQLWIPVTFIGCHTCSGRGFYVNPSIDSHGMSMEEFRELGQEFKEEYKSGFYDVACEHCKGDRVVPYPTRQEDEDRLKDWGNIMQSEIDDWESERELREMGG